MFFINPFIYGGAGGDFESIATVTATGSASTFSFTNIPGTYQHLQLRGISRANTGSATNPTGVDIRFNGDSGSNYAYHRLYGDGSSASADGGASSNVGVTGQWHMGNSATASAYGAMILDILDYASTTKNKTIRTFSGGDRNGGGSVWLTSSHWRNSSTAITSIDLIFYTNPTTASTFALYGIKAP